MLSRKQRISSSYLVHPIPLVRALVPAICCVLLAACATTAGSPSANATVTGSPSPTATATSASATAASGTPAPTATTGASPSLAQLTVYVGSSSGEFFGVNAQ